MFYLFVYLYILSCFLDGSEHVDTPKMFKNITGGNEDSSVDAGSTAYSILELGKFHPAGI